MVNLGLTRVTSLIAFDATEPATIISLIRSAIDIVLYLFVVVELTKVESVFGTSVKIRTP